MRAIDGPCKNCTERYIGCHGSCFEYKQYKVRIEDIRQQEKNANRIENLYQPSIKRAKDRMFKNMRYGKK